MGEERWVPKPPPTPPEPPPVPHRCAVPGCSLAIPQRLVMCAEHWRMVPRQLQNDVYRTYRERLRTAVRPYEPYVEACRLAVAAVLEQFRDGDEEEEER